MGEPTFTEAPRATVDQQNPLTKQGLQQIQQIMGMYNPTAAVGQMNAAAPDFNILRNLITGGTPQAMQNEAAQMRNTVGQQISDLWGGNYNINSGPFNANLAKGLGDVEANYMTNRNALNTGVMKDLFGSQLNAANQAFSAANQANYGYRAPEWQTRNMVQNASPLEQIMSLFGAGVQGATGLAGLLGGLPG